METLATQRVAELLGRRHVAARLRFSTSANIASIELYQRERSPRAIERRLRIRGWVPVASCLGMPPGVTGTLYHHHSVTVQRYRRTRAMLLDFMERCALTSPATVPKAPMPIAWPPVYLLALPSPRPMLLLAAPAAKTPRYESPPVLLLPPPGPVWSTPALIDIGMGSQHGWSIIQSLDALPTNRIVVAGPDHAPMVVERDVSEEWFPWKATDKRRYRWDLFDWWRPVPTRAHR